MKRVLTLTSVLLMVGMSTQAQDSVKISKFKIPWFSYKNGLGITTPDSLFSLNFRFRVQSRVGYTSESDKDMTPKEFDFRVRRIRMRIGGFIYTPRLTYNIQLSFSRADMDWDVSQVPNVLRDAMIAYETKQGFTFAMGQGKLPGNRQRIISSGEQQFADRSIVNNALTLDRDFGVFVNYTNHYKQFYFILKTAISSGEGRNILNSDKGLAYTARLELLPLGKFTDNGEYFEGDLVREPNPKLAIGAMVHYNHLAKRTQGELGPYMYEQRSFNGYDADMVFKYKGFALSSEYLYRGTANPLTNNADSALRYAYVGQGVNTQASYCFKTKTEIAVRYSYLLPSKQLQLYENQKSEYAICLSQYIMKHRLKVQTDFTYHTEANPTKTLVNKNNFNWRFQIELGI